MSNTPSNAEAWDLWLESITGGHHPASLAKFARAVLEKWGTPQPVAREPELDQFLSDVMTAAGLVTHGKQCKQLGERLGAAVMKLRVHNIPQKGGG